MENKENIFILLQFILLKRQWLLLKMETSYLVIISKIVQIKIPGVATISKLHKLLKYSTILAISVLWMISQQQLVSPWVLLILHHTMTIYCVYSISEKKCHLILPNLLLQDQRSNLYLQCLCTSLTH